MQSYPVGKALYCQHVKSQFKVMAIKNTNLQQTNTAIDSVEAGHHFTSKKIDVAALTDSLESSVHQCLI